MMRFPQFAAVGLVFVLAVAMATIPLRRRVMPATHATAADPADAMISTRAEARTSRAALPSTAPSAGVPAPATERAVAPAPTPAPGTLSPMAAPQSDEIAAAASADAFHVIPAEEAPAGHAGMMAAIDAEGRISAPTPAPRAALELTLPALDRSDVGLRIITLADGAEMMRLDDRFMEYAVARVDARGRVRMDCVPGPEVEPLLHRDAPANTPIER